MRRISFSKQLNKVLQRGVALALLSLFISIPIIEALHHHSSSGDIQISTNKNQNSVEKVIHTPSPICDICKFLSTQQTGNSIGFDSIELLTFFKSTITVNTLYLLSVFKSLVHCWTNKGPPSLV
ncbi:MAG: hypothetical protein WKF66_07450 [Pedobacter sp.]